MAKQEKKEKELILCHEDKIEFLSNIVKGGNIPHAFLLSGPQGIGKSSVAYEFAKMVLSIGKKPVEKAQDEVVEIDMFGTPASAKKDEDAVLINEIVSEKIKNKNHLDLMVMEKNDEDAKNIGVDEARQISRFLSLTPAESQYRVVIIDSIDDFNHNSSNAILKILEEPTRNTVLIILCHSKINLLPTIRSRCLEVKFSPLSKKDFLLILSDLGHGDINLEEVYDLSEGSAGLALEIIKKDALKTLDKYRNIIRQKVVNISDISALTKEIKDKDSWKIFSTLFLKTYSNQLKNNKNIKEKDLINFKKLNEIIYFSDFRNMDIQDTLKVLTLQIKQY